MKIEALTLLATFSPLMTATLVGLLNKRISLITASALTISGVFLSFLCALILGYTFFISGQKAIEFTLYHWASGGGIFPYDFSVGFLVDALTATMLLVVTFVSLLVHIYSIGYMHGDEGYRRFFAYISLFTFAMLMLVTSNNLLQLFFGWEGVGLVSYLLIGFWYQKPSAIEGNLKAFLVNRVGDFGFILGIGLVLISVGSLQYTDLFQTVPKLLGTHYSLTSSMSVSIVTLICLCFFVGAMGKSAQVPLHVWLPESMEGPTPISALIHAATMVTAGVFMLARMSPVFEYSETALSVVMVIGATGAFFTGLIGLVMDDIKRVVAYSTLSQLGYMMVAMGASAYSAGMFHLVTHACFKALLFLAAGSVIIAMHHEQDMKKMGGLKRYMPITYWTTLIGALALCALPPFSGFFSKDIIIEAAHHTKTAGAHYAYLCVYWGAFVTSLYTFRAFWLTYHGEPRMDEHTKSHLKESPFSVTFPLVVLAIPSLLLGYYLMYPMVFSANSPLKDAIFVLPTHNVLSHFSAHEMHPFGMMKHAPYSGTFWMFVAAFCLTAYLYLINPGLRIKLKQCVKWPRAILLHKFGFDCFNQLVLVNGVKAMGQIFYKVGDVLFIDGLIVNGSAKCVAVISRVTRKLQTGYLYHYLTVMVFTLLLLMYWVVR